MILIAGWTLRSPIRLALGLPTILEVKASLARGPKVPLAGIPPGHVMVALVTGQSNAGNYGTEDAFPEHVGVFNFFSGALYLATDPMPGSDWTGSTPWIPLGMMRIR